jgi:lipoate-protein ligase B
MFNNKNNMFYINLPETDFSEALDLQQRIAAAKIKKIINSDIVLMLEHPSVFTLGRHGGIENLNVSESFLKNLNIKVVKTERGGNITYHAPGQLIIYPIINIENLKLGVAQYVSMLEDIMIRIAGDWGINAKSNKKNRGIWIQNKKIGSVGIAVKRGVAFHGIALNINISLEPFKWINPCGFKNIAITSIQNELSISVPMDKIYQSAIYHFGNVFNVKIEKIELDNIKFSLYLER